MHTQRACDVTFVNTHKYGSGHAQSTYTRRGWSVVFVYTDEFVFWLSAGSIIPTACVQFCITGAAFCESVCVLVRLVWLVRATDGGVGVASMRNGTVSKLFLLWIGGG